MVEQAQAAAAGMAAAVDESAAIGLPPLPLSFTQLAAELQALTAGCLSASGLQVCCSSDVGAEIMYCWPVDKRCKSSASD